MDIEKETHLTDEEEDLEALRLAALQSLKKKNVETNKTIIFQNDSEQILRQGRLHKGFNGKKGRNFGGRGSRNGQFYGSRHRSTNLISITPITNDNEKPKCENTDSMFTRPQDRYSNTQDEKRDKTDEILSKFDRYNDSDKSEEESEDDSPKINSDNTSSPKLLRSDSLEALMQELDDEIQGKVKTKEKDETNLRTKLKVKKGKDLTKVEIEVSGSTDKISQEKVEMQEKEVKTADSVKTEYRGDPGLTLSILGGQPGGSEPQPKKRRHGFHPRKDFHNYRHSNQLSSPPPFTNVLPNIVSIQFPPGVPPMFSPGYGPPNIMVPPPSMPFFDRPLSPLSINAETLQTQTMAPLSPRSAAFVLENRAIIEKRKRSPRRSYSRSPSPRRRSSSDQRRSLSPWKRSPKRRSNSPMRSSSPRRRSASPRTRQFSPKSRTFSPKAKPVCGPHSPKARLPSPKIRNFSPKQRMFSPKRRSNSPKRADKKESDSSPKSKPSIRERLGYKSTLKSESRDIPDKSEAVQKIEEKLLDPVLEARKRKFETKEIQLKEGVIRLKPKDEVRTEKIDEIKDTKQDNKQDLALPMLTEKVENDESINEDDEIELESKIDLFSDEESGSENEGRFKVKEEVSDKASVLPFTTLVNGTKEKNDVIHSTSLKRKRTRDRPLSRSRTMYQRRLKHDESIRDLKKSRSTRSLSSTKLDRHETPKRFDRKIEIKLKNPSKYDKEDKPKNDNKQGERTRKNETENKKIDDKKPDEDDDFETEIIVENEDEIENTNDEDLRAQLSKKRAEKLNKNSSSDGVPSRLLQNALQNALPIKKTSSKSKPKELSNSDGKLPIHLRLGTCSSEVLNKPKRKSRKRKNVEREGQV
ncbi:uncharacterized protein LOC143206842 [Rhynchophorus ferrugineus]|uniref:uncharacterized protein LOC143206842 n=1 Tax=Rhynchophorus ferrugineus TaxID=354439 RepID=UPI003FCE8F8C